jgi:hypothetical protein
MLRKATLAATALLAAIATVEPAAAEPQKAIAALALAPDADWGEPVGDEALAGLRGGFNGLAFSVYFTGMFDSLGNSTGTLATDTTGTFVSPDGTTTIADGTVTSTANIGQLGDARGVFFFNQIAGNMNVLNTQLTIQISIINVINSGTAPTLQSVLGF